MSNAGKRVLGCAIAIILLLVCFVCTPNGRAIVNGYFSSLHKTDDATTYESQKHVEDTCRTMMASYLSDKMIFEQYRDNNNELATQAKIRANKTAAMYNDYILKNSFVWRGNVPQDILRTLEYID